jgi:diguanylate cyclase (GGDEF)-like protein
MKRSAAERRLVWVGVALVIAIALADWQIIRMQRQAALANFLVGQTNLTNGMAGQTARTLGTVDAALGEIQHALAASRDQMTEVMPALLRTQSTVDLLENRFKRLSGLDSLSIVDAGGHVQSSARAQIGGKQEDELPPDMVGQLRGGTNQLLAIGAPVQNPANGRWTVQLARRLSDGDGGMEGAVVAKLSLDELEDFYRVAMPPRRLLTLLRQDGTILLHHPNQAGFAGKKVPADTPYAKAVSRGGGFYVGPDYIDQVPLLAVVRPLPGLPLVLQSSITEAEVLEGWRVGRRWTILGGVVACAAALGLLQLFGGQLQRLAVQNRQLDEARSQLDVAISNVSQGISFFDAQQRLIVFNRRFGDIYRMPNGVAHIGSSFADLIDQWFARGGATNISRQAMLIGHAAQLRAGKPNNMMLELPDGRTVAVHEQPLPDGGWVATHEDITDRRQAEERIRFLARHDVLTGLPNRGLLMTRIKQALPGARRGPGFAVLFLDLDRFKMVNDTLGHAAGDTLLQQVAGRLTACVQAGDTVARLGGDEFVILQAGVKSPESAASLAQRIIAAVGAPYAIGGNEVVIGVSIGIDIAVTDQTSADELLRSADMALYMAKGEGRGNFRFFEPDMDATMQNRHALERDLRCALERGEFALHYEPIVNARSGRPSGFEALIRWHHPARGLVEPADFIAMAEETGLIIPIGEWVMRQACREAASWPDHIHVSVNLSPVQFRSTNLVEMVQESLADSGLPAHRVELEITESVLLQSNARNLAVMHALRASGIGIVMDDFGVGYSSLKFLRQFPFKRIKIDQCFVQDLNARSDAVCVVRAIIGLCHDLAIKTIAEGVETEDQRHILVAEGCTDLQGHLFSRPVRAAQLGPMLNRTFRPDGAPDVPSGGAAFIAAVLGAAKEG